MEGKMCRGKYWVYHAYYHLSQDITKTKRQKFVFIKIVLAQFPLIIFLDWQRFRQGPLMVKFRIKKIFIDNVSFKNVW